MGQLFLLKWHAQAVTLLLTFLLDNKALVIPPGQGRSNPFFLIAT